MQETLVNKIHRYLLAKEAAESATKIAKELEDDIKVEMIEKNIKKLDYEGNTLLLIQAERRIFDAAILKTLISPSVFRTVTAVEVRTKMFDAAVAVGMISQEVTDQVITKIPYTQLRIGKHKNGTA